MKSLTSFSEYVKYLVTKGLNSDESKAVKEFLSGLYEKTYEIWQPGCCRFIPDMDKTVEKILNNSTAKKYFESVHVRKYTLDGKDAHFFLTLFSSRGKEFVIDPTGVPEGKDHGFFLTM